MTGRELLFGPQVKTVKVDPPDARYRHEAGGGGQSQNQGKRGVGGHDPTARCGRCVQNEAFAGLKQCAGDVGLRLYLNIAQFPESSDCEFVDGLHGGDVVYARILMDIARGSPTG